MKNPEIVKVNLNDLRADFWPQGTKGMAEAKPHNPQTIQKETVRTAEKSTSTLSQVTWPYRPLQNQA